MINEIYFMVNSYQPNTTKQSYCACNSLLEQVHFPKSNQIVLFDTQYKTYKTE